MEEVLIHVNYLIREKMWGSVRVFCDKVFLSLSNINFRNLTKAKMQFWPSGKPLEYLTKAVSPKQLENLRGFKIGGKLVTQQRLLWCFTTPGVVMSTKKQLTRSSCNLMSGRRMLLTRTWFAQQLSSGTPNSSKRPARLFKSWLRIIQTVARRHNALKGGST